MPITPLPNAFTFSNYWNGLKKIIDKINEIISTPPPAQLQEYSFTYDLNTHVGVNFIPLSFEAKLINVTGYETGGNGSIGVASNLGAVFNSCLYTDGASGTLLTHCAKVDETNTKYFLVKIYNYQPNGFTLEVTKTGLPTNNAYVQLSILG